MPEFEAILLDFDGVLADTEPLHWACWSEVLAPLGIVLSWEFYQDHCIGIDDRDMLRVLASQASPPRPWDDLWALYPAKKKLFRERTLAAPPFDPELDAFLGRLHREYKLAVVTSSSCAEIEPLLEAGGLRRHFDALVGGESVAHHKPAPDPYLLGAARLGVRKALVVEDSAAGIASGRAAGFEVLVVEHPADVPGLVLRRLASGAAKA